MNETTRSVTDYLQTDHRRLDAILDEVEQRVGEQAFDVASARFAELVRGLHRHIRQEEEILFPVFEQATGMVHGPTAVMRHEHVEIKRLMGVIEVALGASDARRFGDAAQAFRGVLGDHNMKEETILYPMVDRVAGGAAEREAVVARMVALS